MLFLWKKHKREQFQIRVHLQTWLLLDSKSSEENMQAFRKWYFPLRLRFILVTEIQIKVKLAMFMSWRHGGSIGTAPCILNLSSWWRWVVNFIPWLQPCTYMNCIWRWVGPRASLDILENGTTSLPHPELDHPACNLATIPTELSWLFGTDNATNTCYSKQNFRIHAGHHWTAQVFW